MGSKRRRESPRPPSDPLGPTNGSGTWEYELGQRQQRPRRMKPLATGVISGDWGPAGPRPGACEILMMASSAVLPCSRGERKQMSVLHETRRVGEPP